MIVLEGPDNSGKSTLANAIQNWLGSDVVHIVKSPASVSKGWQDEWEYWLLDHWHEEEKEGILYILDRTPEISEPIYASIFRNGEIRNSKFADQWIKFREYNDLFFLFCLQEGPVVKGVELTPDGSDTAMQNDMLVMSYALMYRLMATILNSGNPQSWSQFKVAPYSYKGSTNDFVEKYIKKCIGINNEHYHNMPEIIAPFIWPSNLSEGEIIDG